MSAWHWLLLGGACVLFIALSVVAEVRRRGTGTLEPSPPVRPPPASAQRHLNQRFLRRLNLATLIAPVVGLVISILAGASVWQVLYGTLASFVIAYALWNLAFFSMYFVAWRRARREYRENEGLPAGR